MAPKNTARAFLAGLTQSPLRARFCPPMSTRLDICYLRSRWLGRASSLQVSGFCSCTVHLCLVEDAYEAFLMGYSADTISRSFSRAGPSRRCFRLLARLFRHLATVHEPRASSKRDGAQGRKPKSEGHGGHRSHHHRSRQHRGSDRNQRDSSFSSRGGSPDLRRRSVSRLRDISPGGPGQSADLEAPPAGRSHWGCSRAAVGPHVVNAVDTGAEGRQPARGYSFHGRRQQCRCCTPVRGHCPAHHRAAPSQASGSRARSGHRHDPPA